MKLTAYGVLLALYGSTSMAQQVVPPISYIQPAHSGSWTDVNRRAQGLELQIISPDRALIAWQTASPNGGSQWLYGDGKIETDRIVFTMTQVEGGRFPGSAGADQPQARPWGTLLFKPQGCDSAQLSWTPTAAGFSAGQTTLAHIATPGGLRCRIDSAIYQPTDLKSPAAPKSGYSEGQRGVRIGGEVLVTSGDGLWRRRLDGVGNWQRSGLDGLDVWFVIADSSDRGRLFAGGQPGSTTQAAFHVSYDGGRTWEATQQAPLNGDGKPEAFADVVVAPADANVLYASLAGGPGIAVSTDGGRNFKRVNGVTESYFGYSCHLGVLPERPDQLYQGCEALLDSATLAVYKLTGNPEQIGQPRLLADINSIGNRRPQVFATSPSRPDRIYAGLEGALVAVSDDGTLEYVYKAGGASDRDTEPYIYVSAIWIDPANPRHLIFGGGINNTGGELVLFETFDHGLTRSRIPVPAGLRNPKAQTLIPLDANGRHLALVLEENDDDFENSQMRVLRLDLTAIQPAANDMEQRIRVGTGKR